MLNSHGHSFQYAVVQRLGQLHSEGKSRWFIDGVEFPVSVGGHTTHIDFILKSTTGQIYIVAECKRADPAKARWCFARAPYTRRDAVPTEIIFEQFICDDRGLVTRRAVPAIAGSRVYHLGFELKTAETGDGISQRSQAINDAVTQVLRGTSGLINHLQDSAPNQPDTFRSIGFVPLIITTAEIYVTNANLGEANLRTGNLSPQSVKTEKSSAIWFTHHRSPALKPNARSTTAYSDFNQFSLALRNEFARSVAIITTDGIEEFVLRDLEAYLW